MSELKQTRAAVVKNPNGLHARPADLLVKLAMKFSSNIVIVKGFERVDAKSILGILTLAATEGTELSIEAEGADATAAVDALAELVSSTFGEE
ncbi:MAG: HPr family phosphocarrier protein [Planctomycetes bacterium]|nr:HPr family phosphocarrier protein [Planctomycetota bacterium]